MTRHVLDHMTLSVADYARSKAFYAAALKPLGFVKIMEFPPGPSEPVNAVGFGVAGKPSFWLAAKGLQTPDQHIAFGAETRAQVDAFYEAAMAAGAKDHGKPGLRPHYHRNYYAAFVLDPDGHNIEAVCHTPE